MLLLSGTKTLMFDMSVVSKAIKTVKRPIQSTINVLFIKHYIEIKNTNTRAVFHRFRTYLALSLAPKVKVMNKQLL